MRKILSIILISLLLLLGTEFYTKKYYPCDVPVLYKIGSIDSKFKLTDKDVRDHSREAAELLNKAYGKEIFVLSDEAELTINFVFDERSKLISEINQQIEKVDKENTSLQEKIRSYEVAVKIFEKRLAEFNQKVQTYNSQGGAPPETYDELVKEQETLQAEANELNKKANELNLATKNYNVQVGELNQDVSSFNQALTQKPEEGIFDPATNTITIFFVNNKPELIHTIAHEFGHALGMEHVTDEESIMYEMSSKSTKLTNKDIEELNRGCAEIPAYIYWRGIISQKFGNLYD